MRLRPQAAAIDAADLGCGGTDAEAAGVTTRLDWSAAIRPSRRLTNMK